MKRKNFRHLVAITLLLTIPLRLLADDGDPAVSATIEGLLTRLKAETGVPAYSVAIVQDSKLIAASAVGEIDVRNHTKATTTSWFRLASVSKVVGSTMLALLVQDGDLDPNAPVGHYLSELPVQYRQMTVLQLLAHTSGMPHYEERDTLVAATHYDNAVATLASVGDRPLLFEPGAGYRYSSHGYTVLGALYESIAKTPVDESVKAFIGEMTGRESPTLEKIRVRNLRRSNVFEVESGGARTVKPRDQSYSPFGTGMVASAADLAMFGDAVLRSPVLKPATRDMLFQPVTLDDDTIAGNYLYNVAFGWRVSEDPAGRTVYHHSGVTQGARSALVLYPETGLSIAFLSNAAWVAQIERTAFSIAGIVLDREVPDAKGVARHFAGTFDGEAIAGTLFCANSPVSCRLSDERGPFADWLSQYLPDKRKQANWSFLPVRGAGGRRLKIVTSVGLVELREDDSLAGRFEAEIGNNRMLEIQFQPGER